MLEVKEIQQKQKELQAEIKELQYIQKILQLKENLKMAKIEASERSMAIYHESGVSQMSRVLN